MIGNDGWDALPNEDQTSGTDSVNDDDLNDKPRKYYVKDVEVKVLNERVQYYDQDGKLITESLKDYSKKKYFKRI